MWLVRIALLRPYTFIVLALLLLILGIRALEKTPKDIFPSIDIPVISVVWSYNGMPPDEMANEITSNFERAVTTTVNDIEHIESQSLYGISVTKLYFHKNTKIELALGEVTAISQTLLKAMPPGITPPLILVYNAATVPVLQLVLSSPTLSEQRLNDLARNFISTQLATVQGAAVPWPYGGKLREILIDLNPEAMQAYHVSAQEINQALNAQNLIIGAGTVKIGPYEYFVKLNHMPKTIAELNLLPVKSSANLVIYMRDVAHVRDGAPPQTNIVRVDGQRAVMMTIQKTGNASTLDIVRRVKALLPQIQSGLPKDVSIRLFSDQSVFVTAAIENVITEGIIAALLTAFMILLFLGHLNSTFIIILSIPLSILASLATLALLGQTINLMTLGGLALAVGMLVDDATVTIENINYHLEHGKPIEQAILDGAKQIATPAFVSTLCICIVFIPMLDLSGVAQYLFVPMAQAVVFAMLASYIISRTLVPTLAKYWLHNVNTERDSGQARGFYKGHVWFKNQFNHFQHGYYTYLAYILEHAQWFVLMFIGFILGSILILWPWLGENFFPEVDGGQIKLHVHAPTGTRIEETARLADKIDRLIRKIIPKQDLDTLVDNIGLPNSGINLTYNNSATVGPEDIDILISLKKIKRKTARYTDQLRQALNNAFPGVGFAFLPADIVNQTLNFGLPSPINIQVMGWNEEECRKYTYRLLEKIKQIPGIVDVRTRQSYNYPEVHIDLDRSIASELGITALNVGVNLMVSLSGNHQTTPNFWVDPNNRVAYPLITQVPQYHMDSLEKLKNILLTPSLPNQKDQILGALAHFSKGWGPVVVSHYNVQPVIDLFANIQGRDLGAIHQDILRIIRKHMPTLPKGVRLNIRGQIQTLQHTYHELYSGLFFSIVLIYLLIVVNFQSWQYPLIIISALPAALCGITWMLFLTHTTISVPALTGAILCMGVATANSILLISFAAEEIKVQHNALQAALAAGVTRLRPVLMTAAAMIIGMLPMALGLGTGGEQNAPLGRAVIGGLSLATLATLFFVPAVFVLMNRSPYQRHL